MSAPHQHAPVALIRASDAEILGTEQSRTMLLADSPATAAAISANRAILASGTDGPPPHYHSQSSETFFVLRGALVVLAGEQVLTLEEGDFLSVPRSTPHAFAAPPDTDADVLIVYAPASTARFEYFRIVDRVLKGHADPQEILDTQERFDNHFVDSPPWRDARHPARKAGQ